MDPRTFLAEECKSVALALNETLRHDYGPERSRTYFDECRVRLQVVEQALQDDPEMDRENIAENMRKLSSLGSRISLIERAHLGEFSWAFAGIIETIAEKLFFETSWDDDDEKVANAPIIHVVAEGTDYQIVDDEVPPPGDRRIVIVAFPRQLKHHVLLHTIFGHELAHTAIKAEGPGTQMQGALGLAAFGALQDPVQAKAWLCRQDAPPAIRRIAEKDTFVFEEDWLLNWRQEIICDLFGLILFGPAFAAAHRTIIEALCPSDEFFDLESTTHPPYPIRQRILATAIEKLGWHQTVTSAEDGPVHAGELALLKYVTDGIANPWFSIFDADHIGGIVDALRETLESYGLAYEPPSAQTLIELVDRLSQERPPISQSIDDQGVPTNDAVAAAHCL